MTTHDYAIEAMHDGSHARREGVDDCPHQRGTPECRHWWQGWRCVDRVDRADQHDEAGRRAVG